MSYHVVQASAPPSQPSSSPTKSTLSTLNAHGIALSCCFGDILEATLSLVPVTPNFAGQDSGTVFVSVNHTLLTPSLF